MMETKLKQQHGVVSLDQSCSGVNGGTLGKGDTFNQRLELIRFGETKFKGCASDNPEYLYLLVRKQLATLKGVMMAKSAVLALEKIQPRLSKEMIIDKKTGSTRESLVMQSGKDRDLLLIFEGMIRSDIANPDDVRWDNRIFVNANKVKKISKDMEKEGKLTREIITGARNPNITYKYRKGGAYQSKKISKHVRDSIFIGYETEQELLKTIVKKH